VLYHHVYAERNSLHYLKEKMHFMGYSDWNYSWFISVSPNECWNINFKYATTASFYHLYSSSNTPNFRRKFTLKQCCLNNLRISFVGFCAVARVTVGVKFTDKPRRFLCTGQRFDSPNKHFIQHDLCNQEGQGLSSLFLYLI
jgi:hypothetical protein